MAGDLYYDSNLLLVPGSGSPGSTAFVDKSPLPKTLVANGNVTTTNTMSRFNTGSMYFDGTTDWIAVTNTPDFYFNYSAFTIEAWIYINADSSPDAGGSRHGGIFGVNNPANTAVISFILVGNTTTTGTGFLLEYMSGAAMTSRASAQAISKGAWHHVAVCSDDKSVRFYLDGVGYATTPLAMNIPYDATSIVSIGRASGFSTWERYFNGYINDLRVTRGVARYITDFTPSIDAVPTFPYQPEGAIYGPGDSNYTSVVLLLHSEGFEGGTTFVDSGPAPKTFTAYGNAHISTTQSKFGGSSIYFDGSGDYLSTPTSTDFDFGTGDFTIECFIRPASITQSAIVVGRQDPSNGMALQLVQVNSGITLTTRSQGGGTVYTFNGGTSLTSTGWHHIAATRQSSTARLWIDGVLVGSQADPSVLNCSRPLTIGIGDDTTLFFPYTGYVDDVRITKGVARYTAAFAAPTTPFENTLPDITYPAEVAVSGDARFAAVSLLLHGDGTNGSLVFADTSPAPKVITQFGTARISAAQSKFGGASMFFPGDATSYLTTPWHPHFDLGTGNFTLEAWVMIPTGVSLVDNQFSILCAGRQDTSAEGGGWDFHVYNSSIMQIGLEKVLTNGTTVSFVWNTAAAMQANRWYHVSVCRYNGATTGFVDGVSLGTNDTFNGIALPVPNSHSILIGTGGSVGTIGFWPCSGYIEDLRVTRAARYIYPFTPPTEAAPDTLSRALKISGTVLDGSGYPALREVRVYRRDTGVLLGNTYSNAVTGNYAYETPDLFEHTLVYLPGPAEKLNALIRDRVIPK